MERIQCYSHCYFNDLDLHFQPDSVIRTASDAPLFCHRSVLASHSTFLKEILSSVDQTSNEDIVIIVPDFSGSEIETLLEFLYGKLNMLSTSDDLVDVLLQKKPNQENNTRLEAKVVSDGSGECAQEVVNVNSNFDGYFLDYEVGVDEYELETAEVLIDNNNYEDVETDSGVNTLFCVVCNAGFSSNFQLREHMLFHPVCSLCHIQCQSELDLLEHWASHPQCMFCGEAQLGMAELEIHQASHHNTAGLDVVNGNLDVSIEIGNIEIDADPFLNGQKCTELLQEINPDLMIENIECTSGNVGLETSRDVSVCNFCNLIFANTEDLNEHTSIEHKEYLEAIDPDHHQAPVNETPQRFSFRCSLCHIEFEKVSQLTKHVDEYHLLEKTDSGNSFTCKFCPELTFSTIQDLIAHDSSLHSKEDDRSVSCPDCSRSFRNVRLLKNHLGTHVSVKPYQCGRCHKLFSWENGLRSHVALINCHAKSGQRTRRKLPPKKQQRMVEKNVSNIDKLEVRTDSCRNETISVPVQQRSIEKGKKFTCNECGAQEKSRELIRQHVFTCNAVRVKMMKSNLQVPEKHAEQEAPCLDKTHGDNPESGAIEESKVSCINENPLDIGMTNETCEDQIVVLPLSGSEAAVEFEGLITAGVKDFVVEVGESVQECERININNNNSSESADLNVNVSSNKDKKKPFKPYIHECDVCSKMFKSKSHLKEHYMTHTKVFPFNCHACGRGFRRENAFQKHHAHCSNLKEKNPLESQSDRSQDEEKSFLDEFQRSIEKEDEEALKAEGKCARFECSICKIGFPGMLALDTHMLDCHVSQDQITPITRPGSETTRSGRVIKPKRFFEDEHPETVTRKRRRKDGAGVNSCNLPTIDTKDKESSCLMGRTSRAPRVSTQCQFCGKVMDTHVELFKHVMSHLDQDIVKTFPVYEEGETGWCPNCSEPILLDFSEEHMLEKHPEMVSSNEGAMAGPDVSGIMMKSFDLDSQSERDLERMMSVTVQLHKMRM